MAPFWERKTQAVRDDKIGTTEFKHWPRNVIKTEIDTRTEEKNQVGKLSWIFVKNINRNIPTTWKWARGVLVRGILPNWREVNKARFQNTCEVILDYPRFLKTKGSRTLDESAVSAEGTSFRCPWYYPTEGADAKTSTHAHKLERCSHFTFCQTR